MTHHAAKLGRRHFDDTGVVSLWDAEVLLVEVHQLHLVVRDLLLVGSLEHEGDCVSLILGLHGDDVVIGGTPGEIGPYNNNAIFRRATHLRILPMLSRFIPIESCLSQRNLSKPSERRLTETSET